MAGLRMTLQQRSLYEGLVQVRGPVPGRRIECFPYEWRTANSLQKKGLIRILGTRNDSGFFEVQVTPEAESLVQGKCKKQGCPNA